MWFRTVMDRRYWRNLSFFKALFYVFLVAVIITLFINLIILCTHPERAVQLVDYFGLPPMYLSSDLACPKICNTFKQGYIISNPEFCSSNLHLLFLVTSTHLNRNRRNIIRQTWGSATEYQSKKILTLFVVGLPPFSDTKIYESENQLYSDLLVVNISDSYSYLTSKTGLALQWVSEFCTSAKYIMKTDDDSFNLPFAIINHLQGLNYGSDFMSGECASGIKPYRDLHHKWFVPESEYSSSYYPLYLRGRGYLLTKSAIRKLLDTARFVHFNRMEDVFWTGLVRLKSNMKATCSAGYAITVEHVDVPQCTVRSLGLVNIHHVTQLQMVTYWSWIINKTDILCHQKTTGLDIMNYKSKCVVLLLMICSLAIYLYKIKRTSPDMHN